jgi:PAS domain S-box-containing protein
MTDRRSPDELRAEIDVLKQRIAELERGRSPAEEAARAAEARLRTLFAAVPDLIIRIRRDGTFIDFSPSTEFTTYVPPDRFLGAKIREIMPPEIVEPIMAGIERALERRSREIVEYDLQERDGPARHFEARIAVSGPDEVVAVVRDITGRARAEAALRESEQRYRDVVEHSLGLIGIHDLDGNLLSVNPAAAHSVGYEPHELVGRSLTDLLVPSARPLFGAYQQRIRDEGEDAGIIHIVGRGGMDRYWTYRNVLRREKDAEPYVIGLALDVTELKLAERAAGAHEARYRDLCRHVPVALCRLSPDDRVLSANGALLTMLGYESEGELVGRDVRELLMEGQVRDRLFASWQDGAEVSAQEVTWRRKDGTPASARSCGWPVLLDDGRLDSLQIVAEPAESGSD